MTVTAIRIAAIVASILASTTADGGRDLEASLDAAGSNRAQIELAIKECPATEHPGMRWLVEHMPVEDLKTLNARFLLDNCTQAYTAWRAAPWHDQVSEGLFFDAILPYACIDEPRDEWRTLLRERCLKIIDGAPTPGAAAVKLNTQLFPLVGVKYSTQRKRADQTPRESIESGLASCTGLSILLIDACRSVGIPARFAGIPMWTDGSGNHSWVEIWDGSWHFTGAAEPSGDDLDRAWFSERAATARRDEPMHAIYAVTWNDSPLTFPPAWRERGDPEDGRVRAVNVTERYTSKTVQVPLGMSPLRMRVITRAGRVARPVAIADSTGAVLFEGTSRDEGFDSNDHLTAILPMGSEVTITTPGAIPTKVMIAAENSLVDLTVQGSSEAVEALGKFLRSHAPREVQGQPFATVALTREDAAAAAELLWKRLMSLERATRAKELESGVIEVSGVKMPIWFATYGKEPDGGHSLFISMHGGGGAPKAVNDQQWKNQQKLYEPAEGIYVAPRAPTDTWNLWHQGHIDPLFDRLIEDMVIVHGVNPDRVYLMGYSAGGDGVYQLAPRMADRFAAVAMMAGHPNETRPDGLRNLPFALHIGANDAPFDRSKVAQHWKTLLAELAAKDPGGYPHVVEIHDGKAHWMDREDAVAIPWMATHSRAGRPTRIVWLQDDVTHDHFYWLAVGTPKERTRVEVSRDGQRFTVDAPAEVAGIRLLLDDSMCDLDKPVEIRRGSAVFSGTPVRTISVIERSLAERADPKSISCAELAVPDAD
ncbi:MAG: polyhydroxyalkanoate depolymerase [Phycisphaerales bacterium]|nr:polyhydroxyalkanoate depolymerase [Phycisphaerales bacterium]